MKSRASLLLMEQLIMILVFALAAAICLQIFAKGEVISTEVTQLDEALVLAQNAAEVLKATGGDATQAEALATEPFSLKISEVDSQTPGLTMATIEVYGENGCIYSLKTGWQEVLP